MSREVLQGTLDLMVLRTLETMGPQHGLGLAKRILQVSAGVLDLNQGTVYPALLRLEQRGWIKGRWGVSDNNRRAKFYALTARGRAQIAPRDGELGADRLRDGAVPRARGAGAVIFDRWLNVFRVRRLDRELEEQLRHHLEALEAEYRDRGMSIDDARRAARRDVGGIAQVKEAYHDVRGLPLVETMWRSVRFAVRSLRRSPAVTAAVVAHARRRDRCNVRHFRRRQRRPAEAVAISGSRSSGCDRAPGARDR